MITIAGWKNEPRRKISKSKELLKLPPSGRVSGRDGSDGQGKAGQSNVFSVDYCKKSAHEISKTVELLTGNRIREIVDSFAKDEDFSYVGVRQQDFDAIYALSVPDEGGRALKCFFRLDEFISVDYDDLVE